MKQRDNDPCPLINFTELSRLAAGHEKSIQRSRIPKIHRKAFNTLFKIVNNWINEYYPENKQK